MATFDWYNLSMLCCFRPKYLVLIWVLISLTACTNENILANAQLAQSTPSLQHPTPKFVRTPNTSTPTRIISTSTKISPTSTIPRTTRSATLVPTAIEIKIPTATPFDLPTQSPLLIRRPSIEQLQDYLFSTHLEYHNPSEKEPLLHLLSEPNNTSLNIFDNSEIIYSDVNGDGSDDLILHHAGGWNWGTPYIFIMLWKDGRYQYTMATSDSSKYRAGSHVSLDDWTGDGKNEVIWDYHTSDGGSGGNTRYYSKSVIHCQETCWIVWHATPHTIGNGWDLTRTRFLKTSDIQIDKKNGQVTVERQGLWLPTINEHRISPLELFASTKVISSWDGRQYEQVSSIDVAPSIDITEMATLTATNGIYIAQIDARFIKGAGQFTAEVTRHRFVCSLNIVNTFQSELFDCNPNFTIVYWADVNNDGTDDVIVQSLFEESQRLQIWDVVGQEFHKIADVSGEVINRDLFGTKLVNIDGDLNLEILVARWGYETEENCFDLCWFEVTKDSIIYDWNGTEFVNVSTNP